MKGRYRLVAGSLAVGLALTAVVTLFLTSGPGSNLGRHPGPAPTSAGHDGAATRSTSSTAGSPTHPSPAPRTPAVRPPADTVRVPSRYLDHYGARRVGWGDVIAKGQPLPKVSSRCADRWRTSGKDRRLDWRSVEFFCLDALVENGFKPQGIAGSATTQRYSIGSRPAAERNIVLISSYSRASVPGLFAPNRAGESVTQLLAVDLDQRRYNTVELVKNDGVDTFRNLNSHGSGLAWAGQYLYSSSHSKLWMFNADDLVQISDHFVLPAVAKWTARGLGGLSSISLDRSATPDQLKTVNYSPNGSAYVHSFDLAADGLLASVTGDSPRDLVLENQFGEKGRVVRSAGSRRIPGTSFQGVGAVGRYTFVNSSGVRTQRSERRKVDAAVVLKDGDVITALHMPEGNGESVFIDYQRGMYRSMVEHGSQFVYAIPLSQLIHTAER